MKTGSRTYSTKPRMWRRALSALILFPVACLFPASALLAGNPDGALRIEVTTAYNFVVRSNVESQGPLVQSAFISARIWNDGPTDLTNVYAYIGDYSNNTPGIYPSRAHPPLVGPLPDEEFALTHEGGSAGLADATRFLGTIPAGGYVPVYWLVSYPQLDENGNSVTQGSKPDDDLFLFYDIWAKGRDGVETLEADVTRKVTMRSCIRAFANKIFPNTAGKVPDEYKELLQKYEPEWLYEKDDGSTGTKIITEGIWYDLGNVNKGFDNDGDLVPDQNAWLQPVGDPSMFDAGAFRLAKTYALIIVKLKGGGELVIEAEDLLYFTNLPDNTGVVGLVRYDFLVLQGGAASQLTPYQMAASGFDNEKFNGDYGAVLGEGLISEPSLLEIDKTGDELVAPGDTIYYTVTFDNPGVIAVGDPSTGSPLVVQDAIPAGTVYAAFSAGTGNTLPDGVSSYTVLFSTDNGVTWTETEPDPAANVTNIQWWLSDKLETAAGGIVTFSVIVNNPAAGPTVTNTAGLSFGSTTPFLWDSAVTLVSGNNQFGGTVFQDDGPLDDYANGVQDAGEDGIEGVTVLLYYDVNGDGVVDAGDILVGTMQTDENGDYLFTDLFDGNYIAVVAIDDPALPPGYSPTTPLFHAADLDSAMEDPDPVIYLDADFGFAPALRLEKSLVGDPPVYEAREFSYEIEVFNEHPGLGDGEGGSLVYTNYATARDTDKDRGTGWQNHTHILGAPDGLEASLVIANARDEIGATGFSGGTGDINKVEVLVGPLRMLNPDTEAFDFRVYLWFPGAASGILVGQYNHLQLTPEFCTDEIKNH